MVWAAGKRPRKAVEADGGHTGRRKLAHKPGLRERLEDPDHRLAGPERADVLGAGHADHQQDVALGQQFLMAHDAGASLGVEVVREESGFPRALLDQHVEARRLEPVDRVGHQCDTALAWRGLLDDSYLHWDLDNYLGTTGRLCGRATISALGVILVAP